MMRYVSRRGFLQSAMLTAGAAALGPRWVPASAASPMLTVDTRTIEVNKKAAKVFGIVGPGGRSGLVAREGEHFAGSLLNSSGEHLQMHWHGQIRAPADQDRARPDGGALAAGQMDAFEFALTPGTHWMHSHTISEQLLLAAPMVTREKDAGDVQDVIVMLHDFAFRSPQEILAELGGTNVHVRHSMPGGMGSMHRGHRMGSMIDMAQGEHMMGRAHANDIRYDAYLANDRTLDDPEVVQVEKGGRVRLRVINGGTATAFFLSTPSLRSTCIAVDGSPCEPVAAQSYPLAQGQRIDLLLDIPPTGGAFPVLAQVEAAHSVTGIVLATPGVPVRRLATSANQAQGMLGLTFEATLRARAPLADRRPDNTFMIMLGEEPGYRWTINGAVHGEHRPFEVLQGQRIEMTLMNPTGMMHPMHLHGHHFQVVGIGGRRWSGPVRDTVIVLVSPVVV
jgi:FtsP/CotA-like multicopper oxidase with cupredoxin domain